MDALANKKATPELSCSDDRPHGVRTPFRDVSLEQGARVEEKISRHPLSLFPKPPYSSKKKRRQRRPWLDWGRQVLRRYLVASRRANPDLPQAVFHRAACVNVRRGAVGKRQCLLCSHRCLRALRYRVAADHTRIRQCTFLD